ncbi:hypothetical protein R1flu_021565 [Riccia fluitans]|uniref:Uncharacterized protein n=1 Tax=Riccia fluitans TaxID=41844 RepID=A0ABD1ZQX1_9MARC
MLARSSRLARDARDDTLGDIEGQKRSTSTSGGQSRGKRSVLRSSIPSDSEEFDENDVAVPFPSLSKLSSGADKIHCSIVTKRRGVPQKVLFEDGGNTWFTPSVAELLPFSVATGDTIVILAYTPEANKANQENIFVPSFPEFLEQAHSQWIHMDSPTSSKGVGGSKAFLEFVGLANRTFNQKSFKEIGPSIICSERTFDAFHAIVKSWHEPIQGLDDDKQRRVWKGLSMGDIILKKPQKCPTAMISGSFQYPSGSFQDPSSLQLYTTSTVNNDYTPDLLDDTEDQPHMTEATEKYATQAFKAFVPLSEEIQGMDEEIVKAFIHEKNIIRQVPQWKWVGLKGPAHVHPSSKRRMFCERMVLNFSNKQQTVLDFFRGGVFFGEALRLQREVIYIAHTAQEAEFILKFWKELVLCDDDISEWYNKYVKLKLPTQDGEAEDLENPPQKFGQAFADTLFAIDAEDPTVGMTIENSFPMNIDLGDEKHGPAIINEDGLASRFLIDLLAQASKSDLKNEEMVR